MAWLKRNVWKRPAGCVLVGLALWFVTGCEKQSQDGGTSTPTGAPSAGVGGAQAYTPPALSEAERAGLPASIDARVDRAFDEVCKAPYDPAKLGDLAALYYVHGFPAQAALCLERGAQLRPVEMSWWYCLGLAQEKAGDREKAISAYGHALGLQKTYGPGYVRLGDLFIAQDPARAASAYQQALALDPTDAVAYYGLGRAVQAQGHPEEALQLLARAIGVAPDYADAYRAMAEILEASGHQDEAGKYLRWSDACGTPPVLNDHVCHESEAWRS